jgi:hypothetical protein
MNNDNFLGADQKLRLKKPTGWFPAGDGFLQAMTQLSDGAFKLFVFLCLKADRHSAAYVASSRSLGPAIGKSRHAIEAYLHELKTKGFCLVKPSRIPYVGTSVWISESFWPYHSADCTSEDPTSGAYVTAVRKLFLGLGCTSGRFGPPEECQARELEKRGVTLQELEDAMIVGACRKYVSWLNNGASDPVASLNYFETLIEEIRERPFPPGYRDYLRAEVMRLATKWDRSRPPEGRPPKPKKVSIATVNTNEKPVIQRTAKETR